MASVSAAAGYVRSFALRLVVLVLAALVVFLLSPHKYVIEDLGSRLGIRTPSDKVGKSFLVKEQEVFHSYLPYRPNETEGFAYMVSEYISEEYVPYDTIVQDVSAIPYELRWPG